MWFKEYVFNVLIQPFHMILYTVLVGAAIELATESLVYAVIAIYFLIPAEKLLRKFFGFDNAGTLSAAGSFAGGAVFSAMISKLNRPKPSGPKDGEDKPKNLRKNSGSGVVSADDVLIGGSGGAGGSSGGGSGGQGDRTGRPDKVVCGGSGSQGGNGIRTRRIRDR